MSGEPRTCFIHAGTPKTGTSYLQGVFFGSRDRLSAHGFELLPHRQQDHLNLALTLRGLIRDFDPPYVGQVLDRLRAQLAETSASRILITQESLAPTTPEQAAPLMELLAGWDVHVIVTARDIARQVPSAWQQRIQARHVVGMEAFFTAVEKREPLAADFWANHDVPAELGRWSEVVGADRVHLVTCPQPGADPGVLLDRFCSVVGVDRSLLSTEVEVHNVALGRPQAELQRRVNVALGDRLPHSRAGYVRVGQAFLAGRVLQRQQGRKPRLPERMRPWAEGVAADWSEAISATGCEVVGDLAELEPRDDAFDPVLEPIDDAELVDVAATALADILEIRDGELDDVASLRRELEDANRRLAELRGIKQSARALAAAVVRRLRRMSGRQEAG